MGVKGYNDTMNKPLLTTSLLVIMATAAFSAAVPTFTGTVVAKETKDDLEEWAGGCNIYEAASPTVRASSQLAQGGKNQSEYSAKKASDFDLNTAWVEGAAGNGVGQYLEFTYNLKGQNTSPELALTEMRVFNGYRKTRDLWEKNGRVKAFDVTVNGKPYGKVALSDAYRYQTVKIKPIPLPKNQTTVLRFTIADVYPGAKYSDTAVTDLTFDGVGHH